MADLIAVSGMQMEDEFTQWKGKLKDKVSRDLVSSEGEGQAITRHIATSGQSDIRGEPRQSSLDQLTLAARLCG